ncbi:1-deoxy-D-xylulose-5-phosphate reductoisomerase [Mahella australiensis]|uniref:1-deoxy-D-xylulose 5-phosphate reductoisomerase n=1 Tax=Mahella australiensis (strain DSM 15567 / CIP 107919 / 50-1 BON) TaxID=697281 RepID=F4A1N3_MAHA5|nr:1-deoxy-D-xylulose-5-phosphate reductoisomerase [Mahella australiensis]AEE97083.1 1-deoxy-D-xylulose 5-phosphate reductoisomerase [Mahella australiensis 50-1 BON]
MLKKKRIVILGSTGSIGRQALEIIRMHSDRYEVVGLSAYSNIDLLELQIKEFDPLYIAVSDTQKASLLRQRMPDKDIRTGREGINNLASLDDADIVLVSVVGIAGLEPTLTAIKNNKIVALATKEAMVTGGHLVESELKRSKGYIIPVDSEHSAIFQCLKASYNPDREIKRILLTASGGPFKGWPVEDLKQVTPQQALKHPNWNMGKRITIDSATMMNKGFEIIEARWLFNVRPDQIDVLVHPQSIVHSMVEFVDSSIIAQMGLPDMRMAIGYAFSYPERLTTGVGDLDLSVISKLTFEYPDMDAFKCLKLAKNALNTGGSMPTVLNAADEAAVALFLNGSIAFTDIADIIERAMQAHVPLPNPSLEEIHSVDAQTRMFVNNLAKG